MSLTEQKCVPCEGGVPTLTREQAETHLQELTGWALDDDTKEIIKQYAFKNFYKTMAFVNAIAWVANQEGHHPDMEIGYNSCIVRFTTHAIGGLSDNDFICAAKIDAL